MKLMKSALLGSATALVAFTGAQAADLPSTKSAPVEYVRICDVYGAGFFYIPGTQTCLKVGGRVRFELTTQTTKNVVRHSTAGGTIGANQFVNKNGIDSLGWLSRGYLFMDARTQSAWGTVQTVFTLRINSTSGIMGGNSLGGTFATSNAVTPTLDAAYVRFAGFTFGRAASNFTSLPPYMYNTDYWGGFATGIKQLAYTATFGGGFSASIALEDRQDMTSSVTANSLGVNAVTTSIASTATAVGPSRLPNLVGNLRVDQAWGWAQLSGGVTQNTANFATPAVLAVTNGDGPLMKRTGWAIAGTVRINLPMLAAGDHMHLTAGYTDGMLDMITGQGLNGNTPKNGNYMGGLLRADRSMTIYECGVVTVVGCSESTKAWNIGGMFTHYWTPTVRQNFAASYVRVTPGAVTQNTDWQQGGLSRASAWTVGSNVTWSPVGGFDIGLELSYARLNQNLTGRNGALPTAPVASAVAGGFAVSPSIWNARLRVERSF